MTDWDKELAKIDKQLASISDEELMRSAQPAAPAKAGTAPRTLPAGKPAASAGTVSLPGGTAGKPWVAWAKVLVAVGAAAGLMVWPWPARCGAPLIGFTAATGGVALLGLWSALGTWRHRLGLAHVASLLVTAWGLALGAREMLPRVGYAVPTSERAAQWSCDGLPSAAPTVAPSLGPTAPGNLPGGTTSGAPGTAPGSAPTGQAGGTAL